MPERIIDWCVHCGRKHGRLSPPSATKKTEHGVIPEQPDPGSSGVNDSPSLKDGGARKEDFLSAPLDIPNGYW